MHHGGKSYGLLLEPLRYINRPKYDGVIFRRNFRQIISPGGLLDKATQMYLPFGATLANKEFIKEGDGVSWRQGFSHMEHTTDRFAWDGSELSFIGFDEVQHFEEEQFFYMLSRLRSMGGIRGYLRATCNPAPDSWLSRLIQWWWDPETGYAIDERSGVIRWFIRENNEIIWGDSRQELKDKYGSDREPKSFTFIKSNVYDNQILLAKDPEYISNLKALSRIERERLLHGNWKIKAVAGLFFSRQDFEIVPAAPAQGKRVRYWDRASTKKTDDNDPAATAGCRMMRANNGMFYIEDMQRFQEAPFEVEKRIRTTATQDGQSITIYLEQDPGQAGVMEVQYLTKQLAGFTVYPNKVTDPKSKRATPLSAQAQAGNIKLVAGPWNEAFINEAINFNPDDPKCKKDQIDAAAGAFNMLTTQAREFKVWSV